MPCTCGLRLRSPVQFQRYQRRCTAIDKFTTALGVANIAHMYECTDILEWAIVEVFSALERRDRQFTVDPSLMTKVYQFASRHLEPPPVLSTTAPRVTLLARVQEVWADLVSASADPVEWLVAARSLSCQDEFLQAVAYFYILKRGPQAGHRSDPRLTGEDGRRLVIGAFNLNITAASGTPTTTTSSSGAMFGRALAPAPVPAPAYGGWGSTSLFGAPQSSASEPVAVVWQGQYDRTIRTRRDELWGLFHDSPWRLDNVEEAVGA